MNDYKQILSDNIKRIMDAKGLSRKELEERMGLTQPALWRHLNGEGMTIDTLMKYAEVFECTTDELLRGPVDVKMFKPVTDIYKLYPYNMILDVLDGDKKEMDKLYLHGFWDALETCTKREKDVVETYYGQHMTLKETGEKFGVSRERVRQIIHKAFRKLRHPSRRRLYIIDIEKLQAENRSLKDEFFKQGVTINELKEYSSELETALLPYINDFLTIDDLELPTRISNRLKMAGYKYVSDFNGKSLNDLYDIRDMGPKRLCLVVDKLKEHGVELS